MKTKLFCIILLIHQATIIWAYQANTHWQNNQTNKISNGTNDDIDTKIRQTLEEFREKVNWKLDNMMATIAEQHKELNEKLDLKLDNMMTTIVEQHNVVLNRIPSNCEKSDRKWTVVMRRFDGSVNFYRNWTEYKHGFGDNENREFFIGLKKLHAMTTSGRKQLLITMRDCNGTNTYAKYKHFAIDDEEYGYRLSELGKYIGNATDSMRYHITAPFTTQDVDNDMRDDNCAVAYTGAWWYTKCYNSNLFGRYSKQKDDEGGMAWMNQDTRKIRNLCFVEMAIKPAD